MSEISGYKKLQLGRTEKLFLMILSFDTFSAYRISARLKDGFFITPDGVISTGIKSMAYKNVHKRVKRLYSLGLMEKVEGSFKRNAKMYKLTTRGLIEQLLDLNPLLPDILELYRDDPMIETLVYQYFELETIEQFEFFPLIQLRRYLRRCCEAIMSTLDDHRYEMNFFKGSRLSSNSEHGIKNHDDLLPGYMSETIKNEAKKFVFEIVNMSKDENPYQTDPNSNLFPRQALLKDNRFIRTLEEIKKEFDNGCKNYI